MDQPSLMVIFTDVYERTIDDKKRFQVPAPHRNALLAGNEGSVFYIVVGERPNTLSLYPEKFFESKVESLRTDEIRDREVLDFEQSYFSSASRVEMDKQGRIVIPERQLRLSGLGSEIYAAGASYRIDLWKRDDYDQFMEEVAAKRANLHGFLRTGRRPTESSPGSGA